MVMILMVVLGLVLLILGFMVNTGFRKGVTFDTSRHDSWIEDFEKHINTGFKGRVLRLFLPKEGSGLRRFYIKLLDESNTRLSINFLIFIKVTLLVITFIIMYSLEFIINSEHMWQMNVNPTFLMEAALHSLIQKKLYLALLAVYVLPEIIMLGKWILLANRYKRDAIRIENIFELLGGIKGFGCIGILDELIKVGGSYKDILVNCRQRFISDKTAGLEYLRRSSKNKRFSGICDAFRVYTFSDRQIAVQMLERQRAEHEEGAMITMEEDLDILDLIAFLSMVPIIYELANLILLPMLRSINQVFTVF